VNISDAHNANMILILVLINIIYHRYN